MINQIVDTHEEPSAEPGRKAEWEKRAGRSKESGRAPDVIFSSGAGQEPLTKREREVLSFISDGYGCARLQRRPTYAGESSRSLQKRSSTDGM